MAKASAVEPEVLAEVLAGDRVSAGQAARLLGVNPATAVRWLVRGLRADGGRVLKLEGIRVGRKLVTSSAAITRFIVARSAGLAADGTAPQQEPRTPAQRQRAASAAARELDALGVR